jgi:nucleoid-associated protein YgaU
MTRTTGRHAAPRSPRLRPLALAGAAAVSAPLALSAVNVAEAAPIDLGAIAMCESSGNPRASGPVTAAGGHFGLYQFDLPTWRSVGGTGNPRDASPAEQTRRAQMLAAQRGTQPWLASASCWRTAARGRVPASVLGLTAAPAQTPAPARAATPPRTAKPLPASPRSSAAPQRASAGTAVPDGYVIRRGDTLGKIAKRFAVPGGYRAIAAANGIANPNLIFAGDILR